MTSVREGAIKALFNYLRNALPDTTVLRNAVVPTAIPDNGLIILRDGDMGEPEIVLSPPRYTYHHHVALEIIVQQADDQKRDIQLDNLLTKIGQALQHSFLTNAHIDCCTIGNPEIITQPDEGATPLKIAMTPIILEYVTDNPLL